MFSAKYWSEITAVFAAAEDLFAAPFGGHLLKVNWFQRLMLSYKSSLLCRKNTVLLSYYYDRVASQLMDSAASIVVACQVAKVPALDAT